MGRKWTKTNVLILAAIIGLITAILILRPPGPPPTAETVVAVGLIHKGDVLSDAMLKVDKVPLSDLGGRSPVALDAVMGKVALVEIPATAVILPSQLRLKRLADDVEWKVVGGHRVFKRALSVAVDAVISVGGFAQPGDRVDVVATYTRRDQPFTQTILQNVELLAVGPDVRSKVKEDGETSQPDRKTAVLSVWPEEAQLLASWENQGKLRLILRNPNDSQQVVLGNTSGPIVEVTPLTPKSTPQTGTQPKTGTGPVNKPGPPQPTLVVTRGDKTTVYVVSKR